MPARAPFDSVRPHRRRDNLFPQRVRYVDTDPIRTAVANSAAAVRAKQPLPSRLLRSISENSRFAHRRLAITSNVLAIAVVGMEFYIDECPWLSATAWPRSRPATHIPFAGIQHDVHFSRSAGLASSCRRHRELAAACGIHEMPGSEPARRKPLDSGISKFSTSYVVEVPLIGLFICLIRAIAGLTMAMPTGARSACLYRAIDSAGRFHGRRCYSVCCSAAFRWRFRRCVPLFCAGLCAIRYDIVPLFSPEPASRPARGRGERRARSDDDRGAWDRTSPPSWHSISPA